VTERIEGIYVELDRELMLKPRALQTKGLSARTCAYFNDAKLVSHWRTFRCFGRLPPSFYGG
jgi:hypothetical protein